MNSLLQKSQAQLTIGYSPERKWHSCTFERDLDILVIIVVNTHSDWVGTLIGSVP